MKRIVVAALGFVLVTGAGACSEPPAGLNDKTAESADSPILVSNALPTAGSSPSAAVSHSLVTSATNVAYVSAMPGTVNARSVEIRNQTRVGVEPKMVAVVQGGFDPVAIEADVGDELLVTLLNNGLSMRFTIKVPPRRHPGVVRTSPSEGRTDVALNVQVLVVFSEPIEASDLTLSSIRLLRGTSGVSGHAALLDDGLSVQFIPDTPLEPQTTYSLIVDSGIRDLDGDALDEKVVVTFTTSAADVVNTFSQIKPGQIVFVDPWEEAIFVADSTGRRLGRVSQSSGAVDPAVSADGKNIAFSRSCIALSSWCSRIYIITSDGRDPFLLQTGDTLDQPSRPAWSPDGKRIVFDQGRLVSPGFDYRNIYTINADGTGLTQLTHSGYNQWAAWSRDGKRIIFARSEGDAVTGMDYGIFEMDPDGSNVRQLRSGFLDRWPTWSPDGSLIAFVGLNRDDFEVNLFVMNADGSNARVVRSGLDRTRDERPAWSPDGKSITFVVTSASRMCDDIWDFGMVPCGQSARRVGLNGSVYPTWELSSASNLAWQR